MIIDPMTVWVILLAAWCIAGFDWWVRIQAIIHSLGIVSGHLGKVIAAMDEEPSE